MIQTIITSMLAFASTNPPAHSRRLEKYGHIITPIVLFLIGGFILVKSGSLGPLTD